MLSVIRETGVLGADPKTKFVSPFLSAYLINGQLNNCQPLLHITCMFSITRHNYRSNKKANERVQ